MLQLLRPGISAGNEQAATSVHHVDIGAIRTDPARLRKPDQRALFVELGDIDVRGATAAQAIAAKRKRR